MERPVVVGIVNITEDSFSDGGRYLAAEDAIAHARRLHAGGADVIELGPSSSHPDAAKVAPEQEIARLAPVMEALADLPLAVDSYHPATQQYAVAHGATYLNDIQGFPDPGRYDELAGYACRLVVMHSIQRLGPATKVHTDPQAIWPAIEQFFDERLAALESAGITRDRLILDPGLGYFLGNTPEPSLTVLANVGRLKARYDLPILISPSRKSFLRTLTGTDLADIGPATLAAELHAATQGTDYIRTHDPKALSDALKVLAALTGRSDRPSPGWARAGLDYRITT
jgi:dihydropteroate synthase type 2